MPKQTNQQTPWAKVFGIGAVLSLVIGLIAVAFLWPVTVAEPRNYPIAVTGTNPQQVAMVKQALSQGTGTTFKLVDVATRDDALQKMKNREVLSALVLVAPQPEVLTASANGQATNAVALSLAANVQAKVSAFAASQPRPVNTPAPAATVKTTDVVPAQVAKFDIAQLALPLLLGGLVGGVFVSVIVSGRGQRLTALSVYAVCAGIAMYLILNTWFGLLPGDFMPLSAGFALGIFATAVVVAGSYVLFGAKGMALAAALTLLVANPLSGMALPAVFLPEPWGALGQSMTIGAAGALVRGITYFPVSEVLSTPLWTLGLWSVAGALAIVARNRPALKHE